MNKLSHVKLKQTIANKQGREKLRTVIGFKPHTCDHKKTDCTSTARCGSRLNLHRYGFIALERLTVNQLYPKPKKKKKRKRNF